MLISFSMRLKLNSTASIAVLDMQECVLCGGRGGECDSGGDDGRGGGIKVFVHIIKMPQGFTL